MHVASRQVQVVDQRRNAVLPDFHPEIDVIFFRTGDQGVTPRRIVQDRAGIQIRETDPVLPVVGQQYPRPVIKIQLHA